VIAGVALAASVPVGCEREPSPQAASVGAATTQPTTAPAAADLSSLKEYLQDTLTPTAAELPADHPPLNRQPARRGAELHYDVPEQWTAQAPSSTLRQAQYLLPRAEGDAEDGELAVYYFGPNQGGSVRENIARWRGMFVGSDGQPLPDDAVTQETWEIRGLAVTIVDMQGGYRASLLPGVAPAAEEKEDYRLLAAIVETPQGPWFFKAVGPAQTVAEQRPAFLALLRSLRYEPGD